MDNQEYNNTFDLKTESTDQMFPLERTECKDKYWNDLIEDALGPDSHDQIPRGITCKVM